LGFFGRNVRVIVAKGGLKEWRSELKEPDQEALTLDAVVGWKLRFAVDREDRETLNAVVSISGVESRLRLLLSKQGTCDGTRPRSLLNI
jgi:hypothetical protein